MKQKRNWQVRPAQKFEVSDDWLQSQLGRLPYTLTDAQNKAIDLAVNFGDPQFAAEEIRPPATVAGIRPGR